MAVLLLAIVFKLQHQASMEHLAWVIVQPNVILTPLTNAQVYNLNLDTSKFSKTFLYPKSKVANIYICFLLQVLLTAWVVQCLKPATHSCLISMVLSAQLSVR